MRVVRATMGARPLLFVLLVAGGWLAGVGQVLAQVNPDYVTNIAIPGQAEFARGCDLTSAGLGGQPVTAANQSAYIECLVMGPGGKTNDVLNNTTRLQAANPVLLVMGLLYNSPNFAATYNISGLSSSDKVTFLYRLLMFQNPPSSLLTQYAADLDAGTPIQYIYDYIVNDPSFSATNPILEPGVLSGIPPTLTGNLAPPPAPFTLSSVTMTSAKSLRPTSNLVVKAVFNPAASTGEGTAILYLTNAAGQVMQTYPLPAYFTAGQPLTVDFSVLVSSDIGNGTFGVSMGLMYGSGWTPPIWSLALHFATFNKAAEFNSSRKYTTLYNQFYGPDTIEQANIAIPTKKGAHRAMIMLHGGDWTGGDSIVDGPSGETFAKNNYVVVSANYRLGYLPDSTSYWAAQIQDVQLIARWVRANAQAWGVDPNQVCVYGNSAGGHLGNWASTHGATVAGDRSAIYPAEPSTIDCMIDNSGPVDLTATPPASNYPSIMGGALLSTAYPWYYNASPLYLVTAATAPTYIFQGQSDSFLPPSSPMAYQQALQQAGVPNQYVTTTCGHAFSGCSKPQTTAYLNGAMAWVDTVLPPP